MDNKEFALQEHEKWAGKIEVISRAKLETPEDLAVCYTPGVAEPCIKISEDVNLSYKYTRRHNMVAVVTDGSADFLKFDMGNVYMMLGCAILPVIIVYLFLSRYIVQGIALGSVKG